MRPARIAPSSVPRATRRLPSRELLARPSANFRATRAVVAAGHRTAASTTRTPTTPATSLARLDAFPRDRAPARRRLRPAAGRKPRGSSRSAWPMRTRSASPTSRSARAASRACARKCRSRTGRFSKSPNSFIPRTQEIADTLPAGARTLAAAHAAGRARLVDRATRKGKVVKTTSISGFLLLYALSKLKPLRRRSLRFAAEQAALADWLDLVAETARTDYALAAASRAHAQPGQGLRRHP